MWADNGLISLYLETRPETPPGYMHRNPVVRGLVASPEDWRWSSYRSYACGEAGLVRINDWMISPQKRMPSAPEPDRAAREGSAVLTAGSYSAPPGLEKQAADFHEIWIHQLQASLARLSTRGRQVVVDANHDMEEAPDAVVTATRQVVDEVRGEN